ncbi:hypothetical protein BH24BAC1_BH24BAC1_16440 [soil metagenome]
MQARSYLLLPLLLALFLTESPSALATHLKGGEISYRTDAANPLKVYAEVTLYLSTQSPIMESVISVEMGDGTRIRASYDPNIETFLGGHTYKRTWLVEHTYANHGNYRISFTGINRNAGVVNIASSATQTFFLYSWVTLTPLVGGHSSPRLLAPPIIRAVLNQPFRHNLTAYDPDGDSLAYELVVPMSSTNPPMQAEPTSAPGYRYPENFTINPLTGQMAWAAAGMLAGEATTGEFAVAVRATKFRRGQVLSRLVRDFPIVVVPSSFAPPALTILNREALRISPENTLEAPLQQPLEIRLKVDQEGVDSVQLVAFSELFLDPNHRPSFTSSLEQGAVAGVFLFSPQPHHSRSLPYLITYRATYFYAEHPNLPVEKDLTVVLYVTRQVITGQADRDNPPQKLRLYPNPARNEFFVEIPEAQERLLVLYSLDGKEVLRQVLTFPKTRIHRPSHLKSGMYRYTLSGPSGTAQAGKVVLQ